MDKSIIQCLPKIQCSTLISLLIRWVGNSYFSLTLDKVLPAHPQVTLIEVDNPLGRVLDVSRNREIEEVVSAVSL